MVTERTIAENNISTVLVILLPNPNVLGMLAVKLCTNKILQFLTGGAG